MLDLGASGALMESPHWGPSCSVNSAELQLGQQPRNIYINEMLLLCVGQRNNTEKLSTHHFILCCQETSQKSKCLTIMWFQLCSDCCLMTGFTFCGWTFPLISGCDVKQVLYWTFHSELDLHAVYIFIFTKTHICSFLWFLWEQKKPWNEKRTTFKCNSVSSCVWTESADDIISRTWSWTWFRFF